jgi:chitinase
MYWESSADRPAGDGSLVEAFLNHSGGVGHLEDVKNCLDYPESKYDNLRNKFE